MLGCKYINFKIVCFSPNFMGFICSLECMHMNTPDSANVFQLQSV